MNNLAHKLKTGAFRSLLCLLLALTMTLPLASCANADDTSDENPTETADSVVTE